MCVLSKLPLSFVNEIRGIKQQNSNLKVSPKPKSSLRKYYRLEEQALSHFFMMCMNSLRVCIV